jgi:hypothetical protein
MCLLSGRSGPEMGSLKNGNQESRLQRQKWPSVAGTLK